MEVLRNENLRAFSFYKNKSMEANFMTYKNQTSFTNAYDKFEYSENYSYDKLQKKPYKKPISICQHYIICDKISQIQTHKKPIGENHALSIIYNIVCLT